MPYSADQIDRLRGRLVLKNISGGVLNLTNYGQYSFSDSEELNLMDDAVPGTLRASDYSTAKNMVGRATVGKGPSYTTYELAQKIEAGELSVIEDVRPDHTVLRESPQG